ncbi:hypothetical protein EYF80_030961 [Liparis tanakae]|uniref:Uncharacterized protein n=1 Tax=Liparis tanakae TaxID=230148 RepID=A0A4Z2H1N8_9TELE|nr:hypothetical protein EYF80_030961 [Liparis tanakae]
MQLVGYSVRMRGYATGDVSGSHYTCGGEDKVLRLKRCCATWSYTGLKKCVKVKVNYRKRLRDSGPFPKMALASRCRRHNGITLRFLKWERISFSFVKLPDMKKRDSLPPEYINIHT